MNRVAVVGGGTMGCGIALAVAAAGFEVTVVEPDGAAAARASERIAKDALRMNAAAAPERISVARTISELSGFDLAIEAVPEDLQLKEQIFLALEKTLGAQAVLATNTSSLSVSAIADAMEHPRRLIGLHFFNPANVMRLVEVVRGERSDDAAVAIGKAFVESLGKTAVVAADTPGFIVNRVARPYYLQSLYALEEEVGEPADLDAFARGAGFRMGPFELMDLIGLDVNYAVSQSVFSQMEEVRLAPVALQAEMVERGELGRKSGHGFYQYDPSGKRIDDATPPAAPLGPMAAPETIALLGYGPLAGDLAIRLENASAKFQQIALDDQIADLDLQATTIVLDAGDGASDRTEFLIALERTLPQDVILLVDAYATLISRLIEKCKHPERVVGFGILGSLDHQDVVEIVDLDATSDEALELAEEFFGALGKRVQLVGDGPGLFLGRVIGSVINEAIYAVQEHVASADDVDAAMRLGMNYPLGPIEWGREIGAPRVARILTQLAHERGMEFGPARALWVLNVDNSQPPDIVAQMGEASPLVTSSEGEKQR
ncbi:MAG: 3-hydroxybutyryl-CoA dehydrogenase [Candidatus Meridianibacter frigidus]|nr:MAG: 3-hydroxybutyryl-CoA dehydrogenase [Candidatus Eremiobacteraeota bacterium]